MTSTLSFLSHYVATVNLQRETPGISLKRNKQNVFDTLYLPYVVIGARNWVKQFTTELYIF